MYIGTFDDHQKARWQTCHGYEKWVYTGTTTTRKFYFDFTKHWDHIIGGNDYTHTTDFKILWV